MRVVRFSRIATRYARLTRIKTCKSLYLNTIQNAMKYYKMRASCIKNDTHEHTTRTHNTLKYNKLRFFSRTRTMFAYHRSNVTTRTTRKRDTTKRRRHDKRHEQHAQRDIARRSFYDRRIVSRIRHQRENRASSHARRDTTQRRTRVACDRATTRT